VCEALISLGHAVIPVKDRTYFKAIYFRTPDGILFEVATNPPGFSIDEPVSSLGQALRLPPQHEHLRYELENTLQPLSD
jgi:glyoxalase family protein